ncbi:hypothetical protein [Marinomonas posidonica]|uniref:Oxidoreductase molybdopterin binding protein n=1 Tax=Marinomonas posidonica (strain CECT 7376 / NCIMB 14433 / IVIA-Po-181) TaxID=491952 RepID=F6CSX7_MARPP|nr:hypothetical protein [Marinomonas posidonica]AEF53967.1 hypothetical protein Mar181_0917 [Marinomonas posidonica IVIA-Po-181]
MKTTFALILCVFSSFVLSAELSPYRQALPIPDKPQEYSLTINGKHYGYADLVKFPLYQSNFSTIWRASGEFVGPKLTDLLKDAGLEDFQQLYLAAADDYAVIMNADAPDQQTAIVAIALNGQPFKINDKGPFWLVWPSREDTLTPGMNEGDLWVWSLRQIMKVK